MTDTPLFDDERRELQRLRWYMLLRWAGVAVLYPMFLATRMVGDFDYSLVPTHVLAAIAAAYNVAVWATLRRWERVPPKRWRVAYRALGNGQAAADLCVLAASLHFAGGIESWAGAFSPIAVIVVAGIVLRPVDGAAQALLACVLFDAVIIAEATGALGRVSLEVVAPGRDFSARYVASAMVAHNVTVLFVGGLVLYLSHRLRRREDELATLYQVERESVRRLEELDRLKSDFLSAVSHELRTPLTSIVGFANNLRNRWSATTDSAKVEQLGVIERQSVRLRRLVEALLDFSAIESRNLDVRLGPVAVRDAVERAVANADVADVEVDVPGALRVHADGRHVEQILVNLLDNARKYGRPPVRVVAAEEARVAVIAVEDAGSAIPEGLRPALFERFRQLDGGITRTSSGVGLGLALVKGYVEAQGGEVWYEADGAEAGSRFCFTLPLEK